MDFLNRSDMKLTPPEGLSPEELLQWRFYGIARGLVVQPEGMSDAEGVKWRYQRYIKDYLACVKSVDDNIGRVLQYLDEQGLADNTMVIVTSDQGFYLGEHNFFDKRFIYEESLRMPFIVRYPNKIRARSINNDVIANVDFANTLMEVAGINSSQENQGRSFAAMLHGETLEDWRQSMYYHYYEFPFWHHVQPHYGVRTEQYTLAHFYYSIDKWELYDMKTDPDQMVNQIDNPAYVDIVKDLKKELYGLQKKYGNKLSLEEYRAISDKDFGRIVKGAGDNKDVSDLFTKKKTDK